MDSVREPQRKILREQMHRLRSAYRLLQGGRPSAEETLQVRRKLEDVMQTIRLLLRQQGWPEPTVEEPDMETLEEWMWDTTCEATDGCPIEPDGVCEHGYPSWLLQLGLI